MVAAHRRQSDLAIEHIEKSQRLSPRNYLGVPALVTSWAHLCEHRFELAAKDFGVAMRAVPGSPWPYRGLAACLAHLGRFEEAGATIDQLRLTGAKVIPGAAHFSCAAMEELLLSGLHSASRSGRRADRATSGLP